MGLTDDKILLPQTKMVPFGRGVAGDSLLQNLPGDAEVNFYTCLLSSELILSQGLLNDALWFVNWVLKVFSVSPT